MKPGEVWEIIYEGIQIRWTDMDPQLDDEILPVGTKFVITKIRSCDRQPDMFSDEPGPLNGSGIQEVFITINGRETALLDVMFDPEPGPMVRRINYLSRVVDNT